LMGYRTFRTRTEAEALGAREIACPASDEAGNKTSCADCRACGGTAAKAKVSIAIIAHGTVGKMRNYARNVAAMGAAAALA
jgi:imidazole glycerol phosphate synthase subunit HisF